LSNFETDDKHAGIPLKASKPSGSSIRLTRSKSAEISKMLTSEKMAEEPKKEPEDSEPKPPSQLKLPPKKPGSSLPSISNLKIKKPPAPSRGEEDEEEDTPEGKLPQKVSDSSGASSETPTEEKTEKPEASVAAGPAFDNKPGEERKDAREGGPSSPGSGPKPGGTSGLKPKLTPKIPVKPSEKKEVQAGDKEVKPNQAPEKSESTGGSPVPKAPVAPRPQPPRPHVVKPGSGTASRPTQGGSAVPAVSRGKAGGSVSALGLAIDIVACVSALAVGYLLLSDVLNLF